MKSTLPFLLLLGSAWAQTATVPVSDFRSGNLDLWQSKEFQGETLYRIIEDSGRSVLQAHSRASASGLVREYPVDLRKTPFLHWSWKVDNGPRELDERSKAGDDYAARVYLLVSDGIFFWQTRSIAYVWSGSQEQGQHWPNAYAKDNLMMLAVRGREDPWGQWFNERRNVRADLRRFLGKDFTHIEAIAIMSDSDDSGQDSKAYYGEIYFGAD